MDLVFTDERKFFEIVRTTPDLFEAEQMLRGARTAVIYYKEKMHETGDTSLDARLNRLLTLINTEIHYISQRMTKTDIFNTIRELWGEEGLSAVKCRLVMFENERAQRRAITSGANK